MRLSLAVRTRLLHRLALGGAFALALPPTAATPPVPPAGRPSILLVTIDTLRPDSLGWVAGRNETPAIDRLAGEGLALPAVVSPVPLTLPAHASILTGLLPRRHGVRDNGQVLGASPPTLAERLREQGYATAAFVSGYPLRALFGLDRGFERYDDTLPAGADGWLERPAAETTAAALAWLRGARRPFFLWVHYYDPHDPYTPPRPFWRPGARGAYDGEVASVDHAFGVLRGGIPEADRGSLLTILTADHGESLGEHGEQAHGFFIYDTTVLVPAVLHFPGRVAPAREAFAARLVDLLPTIFDLAGLPPLADTDGVSLRPLASGARPAAEPAYVETLQPWITYGWSPLFAVRQGGWKYVSAPRPELYDLELDPGETRNLFEKTPTRAAELAALLARFERLPSAAAAGRTLDPQALESLRALGYAGGPSVSSEPPTVRPDPKDRLTLRNALMEGEGLLRRGDFAGALRRFEWVLERDPWNRFATLRSGVALLKKGDARAAAKRLREAVALDPEQAEARYALADALTRAGDHAVAVPHWMETVRLQPRRTAAWSNLGAALGRAGRLDEAARAFGEALRLEPGNPQLLANLGAARYEQARRELAAGNREAARKAIAEAVSADPSLRRRVATQPDLARLLP
jgi:arylsulfatase A-like enzyme/predicted TPR repeat methyltransferase